MTVRRCIRGAGPQQAVRGVNQKMSVRVSPISRTAAVLIIVVGIFVLFTGVVADVLASEIAGVVFIILGLSLYLLLFRITRRIREDIDREGARSRDP